MKKKTRHYNPSKLIKKAAARRAKMLSMRESGKTVSEIAGRYRVSKQRASELIKKAALERAAGLNVPRGTEHRKIRGITSLTRLTDK